jgi:hypothetical protein
MRLTKKVKNEIKQLYHKGTPIWELAIKYQQPESKIVEVIFGSV